MQLNRWQNGPDNQNCQIKNRIIGNEEVEGYATQSSIIYIGGPSGLLLFFSLGWSHMSRPIRSKDRIPTGNVEIFETVKRKQFMESKHVDM